MKRIIILSFIAMISIAMKAYNGDNFTYDGVDYTVISENDKTCEVYRIEPDYKGSIHLPSYPQTNGKEYTLVAIADRAFQNLSGLTSVTIPNSVTSIGGYAFSGCNSLTSIDIPYSVTSIGESAFECSGLISAIIPSSVSYIGDNVFYGCKNLKFCLIGDLVKEVRSGSFANCDNLEFVCLGQSVKTVADNSFENSGSLWLIMPTDIKKRFGDEVYIIEYFTEEGIPPFEYCFLFKNDCLFEVDDMHLYKVSTKLSGDFIVPDYVKYLDSDAFLGCKDLRSIVIGPSVIEVLDTTLLTFEKSGIKKVAKPSSFKVIINHIPVINYDINNSRTDEDGCMYTNKKQTIYYAPTQLHDNYELPEQVTTIKDYAFAYCENLTSMEIGESVTTIGKYAFSGCRGLKTLKIGAAVRSIGYGAWSDCDAIEKIVCHIPNSLEVSKDIFSVNVYDTATLYVPKGSLEDYMDVAPWCYFYNIKEIELVDEVDDIVVDDANDKIDYNQPYDVYSLSGSKMDETVDHLAPGLYIVRQGSRVAKVPIR